MRNDDTTTFMTCFLLSFSFLLSSILVKIESLQRVFKKSSFDRAGPRLPFCYLLFLYSFECRIPFIPSILLIVYSFMGFCLFIRFLFLFLLIFYGR